MTGIGHNGGPEIDEEVTFPDREGFIAVARSMRDHWLVGFGSEGRYSKAEAWQDLIMECRYEPGKIMNGGKPMLLKPGQLVGAVSYLASRWNWTPKAVRIFLDKLEAEGMITLDYGTYVHPEHTPKQGTQGGKHKGKQAKVLTICKYELYQLGWRAQGQIKGQLEGQMKGKQGANEGQQSKKGRKEEGNKIEDIPPNGGDALVEEIDDATPEHAQAEGVQALEAFRAYNDLAQRIGLPTARTLTPQRRKNLCARLREHGGMDAWQTALANIERSAFLRGNNNRGWRADFDFLVTASKFAKVVDGVYGNGAHAEQAKESTAERLSRMLGEIDLGERRS